MFGQGDQEHGITAAGFSLERPADPRGGMIKLVLPLKKNCKHSEDSVG